jgi:tetratricopeptide (TPR) repeat protein
MKNTAFFVIAFFISGIMTGQPAINYLLKAKALSESGKPERSVELLSEAIAIAPDSRLFVERAEAKLIKGDYSGAISDFNAANNLSRFSGEYGLSKIYAIKGDAATSLYHLEMHMKSPFKKSEKEIMLDPSFRMIENRPEWRQFWKKDWYTILEQKTSEIEYYLSVSKKDEAVELLSELIRDYPDDNAVIYAGALINLSNGKYSEVIRPVSGLLDSEPENEKYLRILAKAQTSISNPAGASTTYTKLIGLEIPDARLLILRAECYRKTGETDKALADIEKFLNIYPGDKEALSIAGKTEATSGDNLKALEYFSKNLELHPGDPECYIDRANSYFVSKSWTLAIRDYSMSLDLNPDNSDIWLNKGIALLNTGKAEDACHDFRTALSMGNKRATDYISRNCIK